jgi:predicted RNA binding protein YcfA (HicA-like mRNA interferase family)
MFGLVRSLIHPYFMHMGRVVSSRQAIKALEADGWSLVRVVGDHHQFRHPVKPGKVTIPHPVKDLPIQVVVSIERQSGVDLRGRRRR